MSALLLRASVGGAMLMAAAAAHAGVVIDGTSNGGRIVLGGPEFEITPELGRRSGENLFHSFERFSVGADQSARFTGGAAIARVVARVTGGRISSIDGVVEVAIPGADFWFINPQGVVFGPDASIDASGSVFVSSADELRFQDGGSFSASAPASGSLTTAAPEAFGFLGRDAGPIILDRTNLTIAPDERVTLAGGDITIRDGSIALAVEDLDRRADVTLVAMSRPGRVDVLDGSVSSQPEGIIRMTGVRRNLVIQGRAVPFVDGLNISSDDSRGKVRIRAGTLVLEGAEIRADNFADTGGTPRVQIDAQDVRLRDNASIRSRAFGDGDAGEVRVRGERISLKNGALIRSETQGNGDGGLVQVIADERVLISRDGSDERTEIGSETLGPGAAGRVLVRAPTILVGDSGTIFSTTRTDATGAGGSVSVRTNRLVLEGGAQIGSAALDESRGTGGSVDVRVTGDLVIRGQSRQINPVSEEPEPSGIFTSSESQVAGAGDAGDLFVEAGRILLQNRGEIASEGFMNDARAGSVTVVFGGGLTIDDAEITTKANRADAGDVTVSGNGVLHMLHGGEISTSVLDDDSRGNAGTVTVGSDLAVLNGGEIKANGVIGRGGDIDIAAGQFLQSQDSEVEALSELGIDGSVSLDAPDTDVVGQLTVLPGAFVDASSLLRPGCVDQAAGRGAGTFGSTGNGRLPDGPDAPLVSGYSNTAGPLTITESFRLGTGC